MRKETCYCHGLLFVFLGVFVGCSMGQAPYSGSVLTRTIGAPASQDYYGFSVSSSGGYVAVGAPQCSLTYLATSTVPTGHFTGDGSPNDGYVDIFQCSDATGLCTYVAQVWPGNYPEPDNRGSCFGFSVALVISSAVSLLVVGMPAEGDYNNGDFSGGFLLFNMANPASPEYVDYINADTDSASYAMGWSVAVSVVSASSIFIFSGMPFYEGGYGAIGGEWCTSVTNCNFNKDNIMTDFSGSYFSDNPTVCSGTSGDCKYMGLSLATAQGYPVVAVGGGYWSANDPPNIALLACSTSSVTCTPTFTPFNPPLTSSGTHLFLQDPSALKFLI